MHADVAKLLKIMTRRGLNEIGSNNNNERRRKISQQLSFFGKNILRHTYSIPLKTQKYITLNVIMINFVL